MEEAEQLRILPTIIGMNEATLGSEWALCAGVLQPELSQEVRTQGHSMVTRNPSASMEFGA